MSAEVVVIAAFPLKSSGTDANVQVRGVSPAVLRVPRQRQDHRGTILSTRPQ